MVFRKYPSLDWGNSLRAKGNSLEFMPVSANIGVIPSLFFWLLHRGTVKVEFDIVGNFYKKIFYNTMRNLQVTHENFWTLTWDENQGQTPNLCDHHRSWWDHLLATPTCAMFHHLKPSRRLAFWDEWWHCEHKTVRHQFYSHLIRSSYRLLGYK